MSTGKSTAIDERWITFTERHNDLLREIRDLLRDRLPEDRCPHGYRLRSSCPACSDPYAPEEPGAEDDLTTFSTIGEAIKAELAEAKELNAWFERQWRDKCRALRAERDAADEALAEAHREVERLAHAVETFRKADPDHAEWPNVPAWAQRGIESLKREVARLTRERDEALDVLRIIDKHDDVEFGPTVESELLDRLNASLGRIYQGSPSIGDRLTAAEALAARYREALESAPIVLPEMARETPPEGTLFSVSLTRLWAWWWVTRKTALAAAPSEEAPGE